MWATAVRDDVAGRIVFVRFVGLEKGICCRSDAAGRIDLFIVFFIDFLFLFEFEEFTLDGAF